MIQKKQVTNLRTDSESESSEYESDWVSEPENENKLQTKPPASNEDDASSDSNDGQTEKCPICFITFKNQEIGSPESCDHCFCVECILEWSRNVNTCPVDRQTFNKILVRESLNGKVINQIPIEPPRVWDPDEILEDRTYCELCGRCDREERMLLCDDCDLGFHIDCLDPPLDSIPAGTWYCPDCQESRTNEDPTVDIYEVQLLMEDAEALGMDQPEEMRRRNATGPR